MINWIQSPKSPEIAKYIDCYWFIEKHLDSVGYAYPKLNPDPAAHLIISPTTQRYHYAMNPGIAEGEGCHWLFAHHQTLQLDHSKPFVHLGIKFHVGALYSLDKLAAEPLTLDEVIAADFQSLFNGKTQEGSSCSAEQLIQLARAEPDNCCALLDELLLPWLLTAKEDQHSLLTRKALQILDTQPIAELGNALFCSQRTLERSFNRVTGLTLKQCQAMNKLEAMLEYLYQRDISDIDWVNVAFEFGFSDQPHLIRHLKKQIGLTPQNYAKRRELTIDVYGGVNSN